MNETLADAILNLLRAEGASFWEACEACAQAISFGFEGLTVTLSAHEQAHLSGTVERAAKAAAKAAHEISPTPHVAAAALAQVLRELAQAGVAQGRKR